MKRVSIVFLFLFILFKSFSQILIEEEFNGGTTAPGGWIFNSIGATLNSNSNYGKTAPSVVMDATNDQITSTTFIAGTANTVSFWAQSTGATPTAGDIITVEYFNGAWLTCTPATFNFNTTARMFEATFPNTATRVRITYIKSTVNVAIDDFTVLNNTSSCTAANFLYFTNITFNSCNANSCEGTDEFLTFKNGNSAFNLSDLEITVPSVGSGPEGTTFCGDVLNPCDEFFTTNAGYVTALNGVAGCAGFFLTPPGGIIPANARVIVFMGNPPSTTINFGTLCGSGGNYYCVFVSNTTNCVGRYSNSAASLRYTTIRNRASGCSVERAFMPSLSSGTDGDIVTFDAAGTATYVSNPGCTGFAVLPITLTNFYAKPNESAVQLYWQVEREENVNYYLIERSTDGLSYSPINTVKSIATISQNYNLEYTTTDYNPQYGINYYRLTNIDNDGQSQTYKIIMLNFNQHHSSDVWINQTETDVVISFTPAFKNKQFYLIDMNGKLICNYKNTNDELNYFIIPKYTLPKGLYVIGCNNSSMPPQKILIN